ncbi:MAG: hypothetical protein F4Y03_08880 [Alphaproteobacteria bacterium]|nr:hypothetical protein [Alphaproteobacteria bacterium]
MPGLIPGIHFRRCDGPEGDARNQSGHDGEAVSGHDGPGVSPNRGNGIDAVECDFPNRRISCPRYRRPRTGTATRHRRNASTRPPPRSRNAGRAGNAP